MSRYYRHNPDEEIRHDWLEGVPRTFQDVKRVMEMPSPSQANFENRIIEHPEDQEEKEA